jgi:hypothetical protein
MAKARRLRPPHNDCAARSYSTEDGAIFRLIKMMVDGFVYGRAKSKKQDCGVRPESPKRTPNRICESVACAIGCGQRPKY